MSTLFRTAPISTRSRSVSRSTRFSSAFRLNLVQHLVQVDRVQDQADCSFGDALGHRFHGRGKPPAHRAQRRKRIHVSKYRRNTPAVTTHDG